MPHLADSVWNEYELDTTTVMAATTLRPTLPLDLISDRESLQHSKKLVRKFPIAKS